MGIVRRAPNLLPMLRATLLAVLLSVTSALQVGVPASAVSRSTVSMNTQYSDPYAFQKKKNAKSGRGELLKGYTVGSLAPGVAVKSGTTVSQMGTSYATENHGLASSRSRRHLEPLRRQDQRAEGDGHGRGAQGQQRRHCLLGPQHR